MIEAISLINQFMKKAISICQPFILAKDAISLLHEMLDKGISPNVSSFKILIKAFCKSSDFRVACELFEIALSICGYKEALYSLMFNELLAGGQL